jgi:hypothetical protein
VLLARLDDIQQAKLQRVEAERAGDALHVTFQREEGLRATVAAEGAGGRLVGVDDVGAETEVRLAVRALVRRVKRHPFVAGVAGDGQGVVAVGAGVGEHGHLVGHHPAVGHHAGAQADDHGVAGSAGGELFFPRVFHLHRPAGSDGQVRTDVFDHHLLFVAEAAADARLDHPDALDRQPEHRGQDAPGVERHLRARADHQPIVLVPAGDTDVRLDGSLLHPRHLVFPLEDVVGRLQGRVHVPQFDAQAARQVALRVAVGKRHVVRLVVDHRRAGGHALAGVEDGGQLLVFDLDQLQRALGDLLGLGGHRGHAIANVAHLAVQADEVQRAGDRVRLAGGRMHHARDVLVGEHRVHPRQGARFADVNPLDPAVGNGAVQQLADQHPAHLHVGSEGGLALRQLHRVQFRLCHTHVSGPGGRHDHGGQLDQG